MAVPRPISGAPRRQSVEHPGELHQLDAISEGLLGIERGLGDNLSFAIICLFWLPPYKRGQHLKTRWKIKNNNNNSSNGLLLLLLSK